jgi:predicted DNA-binding protein (MmcQ/YjbR family)
MAQRLEQAGYLLSYNSDYLRQRNWLQICLMGEYSREKLDGLLEAMSMFSAKRTAPGRPAPPQTSAKASARA